MKGWEWGFIFLCEGLGWDGIFAHEWLGVGLGFPWGGGGMGYRSYCKRT